MTEGFAYRCDCGAELVSPILIGRCPVCGKSTILVPSLGAGRWRITFEPTHSEPYVLVSSDGSEICRFQSPLAVRHYLERCRLPAAEAEMLLTELQVSGEIECPPPEDPE